MNKFSKTKASPILNILGMTIAFAAFYVIMSQVMYDVTFNHSIKDADKKYVVCMSWGDDSWKERIPVQMTKLTSDEIPGAKIGFYHKQQYTNKVYTGEGADEKLYRLGVHLFTRGGADLLEIPFVSGHYPDTDGNVAISETAAETMSVALNDMIFVFDPQSQEKVLVTVTGIYKDFAQNSDFADADVLWSQEEHIMREPDNSYNYNAAVSFINPEDKDKFVELLYKHDLEQAKETMKSYGISEEQQDKVLDKLTHGFKLESLTDIHFSNVNDDVHSRTSRSSVYSMIGIALVIILIAFINFVNFFVALVPEKMRSVNIRKVFGASRGLLIWEFVKEALVYVGVAIILAIVLILAITKSPISEFTDGGIDLTTNVIAFLILVCSSILFAILSAFFPAMYVTNVNAAMGVKCGYSRSVAGRALRKALISFQLAVAIGMMVISTVFYMQYCHVTQRDLGFEKENLFTVGIPYYKPELKARVEQLTGVKAVTASNNHVTGNAGMSMSFSTPDGEVSMLLKLRRVLPNYLDVIGLPMISGEGFTESNTESLIIDAESLNRWPLEDINRLMSKMLAGFCAVTNTKPATDKTIDDVEAYQNMGYDSKYLFFLIVRTEAGADAAMVISQVKEIVREEMDLDEEPNAFTIDDELQERYARFKKQSMIFGLFSLVAIIIALMGVFGIVLFETEHRKHETAVRKVLGAEGNDIVSLFCKQYVVTVIIACPLATPVAIYVTREWLEQFTTKVFVSPWLYFAAFAIVAILTLGIIIFRTISAAKENPVNNLKSE